MSWSLSPIRDIAPADPANYMQKTTQLQAPRASAARASTQVLEAPALAELSLGVTGSELADRVADLARSQRSNNAGVSAAQTAERGLDNIGGLLTRMRDLATQASHESLSVSQRNDIDAAYQILSSGVLRAVAGTSYDGVPVIDGTGGECTYRLGDGADGVTPIVFPDASVVSQGLFGTHVTTPWASSQALEIIDWAIAHVGQMQQHVGDIRNSFAAATLRTLGQQLDLAGADSDLVDVASSLATNALNGKGLQEQAAHLVATVANQMPESAMALLYFHGAANGGR